MIQLMRSLTELNVVVERFNRSELAGPVALAQLLSLCPDLRQLQVWLEERAAHGSRASRELAALSTQYREGCENIARLVVDLGPHASSLEGISEREVRDLFDRAVELCEDGSVALYCLGDKDLLARTTQEIVLAFDAWGVLGPEQDSLEIGCGTGRMQQALSPHVRRAIGVDLSPKMIARARARCAQLPNVQHELVSGDDLSTFAPRSFDLIYAVDSFPYIVGTGAAAVERSVQEVARLLKPSGDFVILNYSYRSDVARDAAELEALAARVGFTLVAAGERCFKHWDGVAFRLRRSP
jgi:SAM-dependent methyltransferase